MALDRLADPRSPNSPVDFEGATNEAKIKSRVKPRVFKPLHVPEPLRGKHRVRLVKKGWESYCGAIAGAMFENAVSVDKLPETTIDRIAALFSIVDEEGNPIGFGARVTEAKRAEVVSAEPLKTRAETDAANPPEVVADRQVFSLEDLQIIADGKGIAGLRTIADPLGVKGRAIPELIAAIMRTQDDLAAKPANFTAEG